MKRFTPLFIIGFVLFPILHSSCVFRSAELRGNYHVTSDTLPVGDYESIELNVSAEIIYRQMPQSEPFLQISTDENILQALSINITGKRLIIESKTDTILKPSRLVIYTNSKNLNELSVSGAGNIRMENEVNAKDLSINISGAAKLYADSLFCENIHLSISGVGNVYITGAATKADIQISGVGNIFADNFLIQDLDCNISGTGKENVFVAQTLHASVSGTGKINYRGNPQTVETSVSGVGAIKKIEE
ncbi:MAG: DUF2807 domain-containing protein [Dysgonamonadaceae bacterium]|jgi:hypothetical protein|nr:DUF2807 domain-containing protein [Dysgonamonadaceae bacterium]